MVDGKKEGKTLSYELIIICLNRWKSGTWYLHH